MNTYKTTDMYLAAYLSAKGHEMLDVEKNKGRMTFVFNDHEQKMKQVVVKYYNGEGSVEPRFLIDAIKNMKSLTHNL